MFPYPDLANSRHSDSHKSFSSFTETARRGSFLDVWNMSVAILDSLFICTFQLNAACTTAGVWVMLNPRQEFFFIRR